MAVRGWSRHFKVYHRTSQQIRERSDRLPPPRFTEADGSEEERRGVVSVFEEPAPEFRTFERTVDEEAALSTWRGLWRPRRLRISFVRFRNIQARVTLWMKRDSNTSS